MSYDPSTYSGTCPNGDGGVLYVVGSGLGLRCQVCGCQFSQNSNGLVSPQAPPPFMPISGFPYAVRTPLPGVLE